MKLKQILKEEESLEYGDGAFTFSETGTAIEKTLIKKIAEAFNTSNDLKNTFLKKDETTKDIIIKLNGPNIIITTNPENGLPQKVGTFPVSMIQTKSPNSIGEIIFETYKKKPI